MNPLKRLHGHSLCDDHGGALALPCKNGRWLPSHRPISPLLAAACLLLAGCGGSAASTPAAAPPSSSSAAPSASANPSAATVASKPSVASSAGPVASAKPSAAGSQAVSAKPSAAASTAAPAKPSVAAAASGSGPVPEKANIAAAVASGGLSAVPEYIAREAGYFKNHGLTVDISQVASSVGNAAISSGSLDFYHGSSSVINAHLAGTDAIYVGAPTDRSPNALFGKKGLTKFSDLRGKTIAMSGPGTTRDIFITHFARLENMEPGKDFTVLYVPGDPAALATFQAGNADAVLVGPPRSTQLVSDGFPVILDFSKAGVNVIEPGMAVSKAWSQKNPNTIKAYLMGYLDGVKRAFDDPAYAKQTEATIAKISDQAILDSDYQMGLGQWNKNLAINPADIQLVLETATDPKAKSAKPEEFYDNTMIDAVNRDYGSKLFPDAIK
jgi:NitT/TauT family transport system substrate-binding protein